MANSPTKATALDVLMTLRDDFVRRETDPVVVRSLAGPLLQQVFEVAWKHQSDDDLQGVSYSLRELVGVAVADALQAEAS